MKRSKSVILLCLAVIAALVWWLTDSLVRLKYSHAPNAPGMPIITERPPDVLVEWEDRSNNETAFYVERTLDSETWTRIATLPANSISYLDTTAEAEIVYFYRIVAHNEAPD